MRRSGAGRGRRPPAICAWEAGPRCRRGSAASSPVWPAGAARSNGAAGRCCNRGPKRSCQIPSPIPGVRQMHIPPWPWFRWPQLEQVLEVCLGSTSTSGIPAHSALERLMALLRFSSFARSICLELMVSPVEKVSLCFTPMSIPMVGSAACLLSLPSPNSGTS